MAVPFAMGILIIGDDGVQSVTAQIVTMTAQRRICSYSAQQVHRYISNIMQIIILHHLNLE